MRHRQEITLQTFNNFLGAFDFAKLVRSRSPTDASLRFGDIARKNTAIEREITKWSCIEPPLKS